jgi:hypothetical protein
MTRFGNKGFIKLIDYPSSNKGCNRAEALDSGGKIFAKARALRRHEQEREPKKMDSGLRYVAGLPGCSRILIFLVSDPV